MRKLNDQLTELRNHATHWQLPGATYFLTWRLRKNLPCLTSAERDLVSSAIKHLDGGHYQLYSYVVMDDHVHIILRPHEGYQLSRVINSLKSFTTNRLWKDFNRTGAVWQKDYFDRIIRSESDLLRKMQYILNNPR
jgi:REP element-mobilizing transposase RayT